MIIAVAILEVAAFNLMLGPAIQDSAMLLLCILIGAVAVFAVDGIFALAIRRLTPSKWYGPDKKIFKVTKAERDFYIKLKIKLWKDKVPELGGFTNFHKDKFKSRSDAEYLKRFIVESNYGVVIHLANALLGFLIAFVPWCSSPGIWIPVFCVNFILSALPVFVLRYTCYTLQHLYANRIKKTNVH